MILSLLILNFMRLFINLGLIIIINKSQQGSALRVFRYGDFLFEWMSWSLKISYFFRNNDNINKIGGENEFTNTQGRITGCVNG